MKKHIFLILFMAISFSPVTWAKVGTFNLQSAYSSWGVSPKFQKSSINLHKAWNIFEKKRDVVVAVVDTGIDQSHPFLKKNLYVPHKKVSSRVFGVDFSKGTKNKFAPIDVHGHGTHISGIVRSVFPEVKILSLKYYNPKAKNKDNLNSTVAALRYAIDKNVDIINYSSGGGGASLEELRVLKEAQRKGILVIVAAGNEASNIDKKDNFYFPASYNLKNMISVINHNKSGNLGLSSNWGPSTAHISAPGSQIKSSFPRSKSRSRVGVLTGTSQSTAFVSGVAALLMGHFPDLGALEVKDLILRSARKDPKLAGRCQTEGALDAYSALKMGITLKKKKDRHLAQKKSLHP